MNGLPNLIRRNPILPAVKEMPSVKELKSMLASVDQSLVYQEAGITTVDFDALRKSNPTLFIKTRIDLSVANLDKPLGLSGTFITVIDLTAGATLQLALSKQSNPKITFDDLTQIELPFTDLFLTNTAQAGASCNIVTMVTGRYTPYFKTKSVATTIGAGGIIRGAVSVLTTAPATLIVTANPLTRQISIYNNDGLNPIYIGEVNTVTALSGMPIPAGTERIFNTTPYYTGAIYGIATGGAVDVRYWIQHE